MKNIEFDGFVELCQEELYNIEGGEGFWSGVWEGIKSFFRGVVDGINAVSLPM